VPVDTGFDDLDTQLMLPVADCNTPQQSALGKRMKKWIKR